LGVGLSSVDVTTTREPVKNTGNPLRSFKERNVRIFFGGIAISNIGTWAQLTVLVLLVRELGGGGLELGIVTACRFAPLLFLGLHAGAIADRWGNRLAIRLEIAAVIAAPLSALGLAAGWLPGGAAYLWISFFLLGLTPVLMRTLMNFALELSEPADHPRYISTLKLCMAVPFVFSPLIGLLVDRAGFHIVFAVITCLIALGGVMTFRLAEPRGGNTGAV